jgi:hypothetical protein
MPDMLRDGLAFLTAQLAANASQEATYSDGASSATVRVMLGSKLLRLFDDVGASRLEWTDMDFLIPAADLILGGLHSLPTRGHTISIVIAENLEVFEVAPYENDPPWRWSDPNETMFRVHTKHIETQPIA